MGEIRPNNAYLGLNLDSIISQVKPGQLTYAKNAQISGFDGNSVTYQNEQANELCFSLPDGFRAIGVHPIIEQNTVIYFLFNPSTGASEIGKAVGCVYSRIINAPCLNFSIQYPILKTEHRVGNCGTEIFWTDGNNPRRYLNLSDLPFEQRVVSETSDPCDVVTTAEIDCNKLNVQPNFSIPTIRYDVVSSEGNLVAGTYQFAIQYANSLGEAYTSYQAVTNPIPINDYFKVTPDFNYITGKSIKVIVDDLDTTGLFDYFNLAVIKTINNISSVDLVGTFQIQAEQQTVLYTGQAKTDITLTIEEIFEKFPIYEKAGDITALQDVLVWADMTLAERISYQSIASQITPQWVNWVLPPAEKQYKDEINAADRRGYMRDEVYAFDMVVINKNGHQSDRFPLVGRAPLAADLAPVFNQDTVPEDSVCEDAQPQPRWKVYNTASVLGTDPAYDPNDLCYQGPYQFGQFAYWESTETYPCNEDVWGNLQGQPIRHFKFPDSSVTHHHDNRGNIYPLGIRIDMLQVYNLINNSPLTQEQKANIAGIKIVRANRAVSKSIVAKGLLFNVGKYTKLGSTYFYPNYPFNDLRPDPFISNSSTGPATQQLFGSFELAQSSGTSETDLYIATIPANIMDRDGDKITAVYNGKFAGAESKKRLRVYFDGITIYDSGQLTVNDSNSWILNITIKRTSSTRLDISNKLQVLGGFPRTFTSTTAITNADLAIDHTLRLTAQAIDFPNVGTALSGDISADSGEVNYVPAPSLDVDPNLLDGFATPDSERRFTFHSPDTSFYQPFLGTQLKLESVEYGFTRSHFVQVKNHSKYRFPSLESYLTALAVGIAVGFASGMYGVSNQPFDGGAAFTTFTILEDIIFRLLPKKNMAYQFNSLGEYTTPEVLPNDTGNKIRLLDIAAYLTPGMQGVGDTLIVNNYQRESSVYLRTTEGLPFPDEIQGVPEDNSRFTLGQTGCVDQFHQRDVSSYYGSIKRNAPDQYGHIYSYDAIDTGFYAPLDVTVEFSGDRYRDVFGGDIFINKFAFKRKLPFFLDNRVGFPDESDIFYDELGNIAFPRYWFSTDIRRGDGGGFNIGTLFGVKVNNFDCENSSFFYDAGKIYLFAYGIVNFFVESEVNVDFRQAYNATEGEYYPHVSGDVPDDWLQESFVPIVQDNTYTYNKTYSKQNIENEFTTLPLDFVPGEDCREHFPNRAIYSDRQRETVGGTRNNWLIYRPVSYYDFPLTYGRLISVDAIETRQLLVRFESRTQLYNSLLTASSSIGDVYLGQQIFNSNVPPVDLAETDLGYTGTQHKFLLKTEFGHIMVDAQRGDVFIFGGQQLQNLANEGVKAFLATNLTFSLKEAFPEYNIDNHFAGVGLHGVYDMYNRRFILTKLDYRPLSSLITYDSTTNTFSFNGSAVELTDPTYFCDVSFSLSYSFITKAWVSFHSYLPNFYVGGINQFQTGNSTSVWSHNTVDTVYNTFFGEVEPYILEYPFAYKQQDEILQCVKDYTKVNRITNLQTFVQVNDVFFNKVIIFNDQQCSGLRNLVAKPRNNMAAYMTYPRFNSDSIDSLFVKSDNFYNYNGFWDVVTDYDQPIWLSGCAPDERVLNTANMDYSNKSFRKYPIRAKDCRIRHILDNRGDVRLTSQFIITETQLSYK
jgi:hypothetical protein